MRLEETPIPGCYEIFPVDLRDHRGRFVKPYHLDSLNESGLGFEILEEYYSLSKENVLRGMHFQLPPMATVKLVTCLKGRIFDAVVDLRTDSPTFGRNFSLELTEEKGNMLYIPEGLAHGFCAPGDESLMLYMCSQIYSGPHDTGIRWDSAGISWPVEDPLVSGKDRGLPRFDQFESPFRMK